MSARRDEKIRVSKALVCSERIVERLLGPPQRGLVHSAFSSAANLLFAGDFLLSLNASVSTPGAAAEPLPMCERAPGIPGAELLMPNGLLVAVPAGERLFARLKVGMPVILGAGWLVVEPLTCSLDCTACPRWNPRLSRPPALEIALLTANARLLRAVSQQQTPASHSLLPVPGQGEDILVLAERLCGRGPGLTPAGDDFLAGWLAAGWLLYGPQPAFLRIGQRIVALAGQRTHLLSQSWLAYAAAGDFASPIHDLIKALHSREPHQLQTAARAVLALGASSGYDLIQGMLYAIEQYPA